MHKVVIVQRARPSESERVLPLPRASTHIHNKYVVRKQLCSRGKSSCLQTPRREWKVQSSVKLATRCTWTAGTHKDTREISSSITGEPRQWQDESDKDISIHEMMLPHGHLQSCVIAALLHATRLCESLHISPERIYWNHFFFNFRFYDRLIWGFSLKDISLQIFFKG